MNARTETLIDEHANSKAKDEFKRDVLHGLSNFPKELPCKYFYDTRGSRLFEEICKTPEYYVTRTELALLREACPQVAALVGSGAEVIEPGSGAGEKIRTLLDALDSPHSFVPVDISKSALAASASRLKIDYPNLEVHPLVADFTRPFSIPAQPERSKSSTDSEKKRRIIFFPGSTISNFCKSSALEFLNELRRHLRPGDFLFIGVDRIKDKQILEAAYDDSQGVTAAFNLNLLERIARELDTTLDPKSFRHRAVYNEDECRIEMHLHSRTRQIVRVCDRNVEFQEGESIHTENSYKYSPGGFRTLANDAGYTLLETFSDKQELFSLYLCRVPK